MTEEKKTHRKFFITLIKPSHYDDQGYVIQWRRSFVPSNTLGCVLALVEDVKARNALGDHVEMVVNAYDEINVVVPTKKIISQIKNEGGNGIVMNDRRAVQSVSADNRFDPEIPKCWYSSCNWRISCQWLYRNASRITGRNSGFTG